VIRWLVAAAVLLAQESPKQATPVSFNRDIRPILSQYCFACHGPDRLKADSDLRLDTREGALAAIVPGRPAESELLRRLTTAPAADRMPPRKSGKKLDARQVNLLRTWIEQGAPWEAPWALTSPKRPALPTVKDPAWPRNPLDRFILTRLEAEGLRPRAEADRDVLLRRVSFDLTGLPPTVEDVDAFLADGAPDAFERAVDRLLASPRYGERMAMEWLDAARYADTHGLHVDSHREMWPWRDGVIRAFNANQPFDQFTIEQLAGDLLPDATPAQKVASGFNRNHMISYQNSSIPEKVRTAYVVDRVNTTATVWLGLTMACAQCHDHKFDPLPQVDYYRLYAFFNTIAEKPLDGQDGNAAPLILLDPDAEKRLPAVGKKERREFLSRTPNSMVMQEMAKPRTTFLLHRGEYDQPRQQVEPGTPGCLPPMASGLPRNRLGLARWLVDPAHPLTARVQVNRLWQMVFGTGIVETSDDFGAQGDGPSHPELLDYLAVEFVESGWDMKAMMRRLVTSATYRQSSRVPPDVLARDPRNRLLARGPRFRLPAEMIRDGALSIGGLLQERIGGPSVYPYQPPGVWEAVASGRPKEYTAQVYPQDRGDNAYRRSLYTFWKRLAPPPGLAAFDAPSREACVVRRQRTNTPLQALVTLNDPTYHEAARGLAARALKESSDDDRIVTAFRAALSRRPSSVEVDVLRTLLREQRSLYGADPNPEMAAWTMVAAALLNLDETLTKG
jgi:uncharacterized protein DUF1553/uncharacterized protein DUF1549/cytochrome c